MTLAALALAYNSWLGLCLSMPRHYRQVWGRESSSARKLLLRVQGWLTMALSFLCAVRAIGWAVGPVEWIGLLSVSGLALVLLLPYAPRLAVGLGVIGLAGAPLMMLM